MFRSAAPSFEVCLFVLCQWCWCSDSVETIWNVWLPLVDHPPPPSTYIYIYKARCSDKINLRFCVKDCFGRVLCCNRWMLLGLVSHSHPCHMAWYFVLFLDWVILTLFDPKKCFETLTSHVLPLAHACPVLTAQSFWLEASGFRLQCFKQYNASFHLVEHVKEHAYCCVVRLGFKSLGYHLQDGWPSCEDCTTRIRNLNFRDFDSRLSGQRPRSGEGPATGSFFKAPPAQPLGHLCFMWHVCCILSWQK